ncbi:two-component system sensor histidine kinase YesM [Paenibacillus taihuensis]|uniref:histidine kinase n=1 Tax=Paenibacillus taihuensis TaxID=1156355 RepID=A0A3D9Q463_9BACL|nr:sensor histidine kinase [Paenibacillus taihuensis]REE57432.1 two-component system sensor histidine kinase YesM [Paenibacillus taihuensis]
MLSLLRDSIKGRMIVILLLSSIVPVSLLGGVSYYSFHSFMENKLKSGVQENLEKELIGLDNILKNLNFAAQQLALDKSITTRVQHYMVSDDQIERKDILLGVLDRMSLINYSSPFAGIIALLDAKTNQPFMQSYPTQSVIHITQHPLLLEANGVMYFAPHQSTDKYNEDHTQVFSLARKVSDYETNTSFYVYVESNFNTLQRLFNNVQYGETVKHLLLDKNDRIVYSEDPAHFPMQAKFKLHDSKSSIRDLRFITASEQGWKLAVVMKGDAFQNEVNSWFGKYVTVGMFSLLLSLLLAYICWRTIYRPLHVFRREIEGVGDDLAHRPKKWLRLREFDEVLGRFYAMKDRVFDLLKEIERREKAKSNVEVEKLKHQINPHFIHNTLNTVQVIAKMNKQNEIVRLITHFTRILHYNLGKEGTHVRVQEEVDNLNDYLALQNIRYSHQFDVRMDINPSTLNEMIPRFVLQPLVENAIYHGFRNRDGMIKVSIDPHPDGGIVMCVADNGEGMPPDRLQSLLEDKSAGGRSVGMGIGLSFVHRLIQAYYGESSGLRIESELGRGTSITILILKGMGGDSYDSGDSGR